VPTSRPHRLPGEAEGPAGKNLWTRARPTAIWLAGEADGKADKTHLVRLWRDIQARGSEERNFSESHQERKISKSHRAW